MRSKEKLWRLRFKLFKVTWRLMYMKYIRIFLIALLDIIGELYTSKKDKG